MRSSFRGSNRSFPKDAKGLMPQPRYYGSGNLFQATREQLDFLVQIHELERIVRAGLADGTTDLWALTQLTNERLGPYPELMTELGASVRAVAAL